MNGTMTIHERSECLEFIAKGPLSRSILRDLVRQARRESDMRGYGKVLLDLGLAEGLAEALDDFTLEGYVGDIFGSCFSIAVVLPSADGQGVSNMEDHPPTAFFFMTTNRTEALSWLLQYTPRMETETGER